MERGFLSQKCSEGGRGVKEKSLNASIIEVGKDGVVPSVSGDSGNVAKEVVSLFGVDETGNGNTKFFDGYNWLGIEPTTTYTGDFFGWNTWGIYGLVRFMFSSSTGLFSFQFSSMDGLDAMLENGPWFIWNNPVILKKWHPDEYLLKEDVSTVLVWVKLHGVPVTACSEDGLSAIATKLGTPLMLDSYTSDMFMQSWGRSSYAIVMIELRADVELKDDIVVAMPKIKGECHYMCNVRVECESRPPMCASCKVFGHIHKEYPKNTCVGEKKTLKKPSQTSRGISAGLKMGFKPRQEYRHVPKKTTASSSGNKKKGVRYQWGTINLVNNEATSSGSSFMNVDNNSIGNTPIMDKIEKFENLVIDGQAILVDKAGNPLKRTGFGTQCLLKQLRDSYGNGDYDEDPYDDDMYEGHVSLKRFKLYAISWICGLQYLTFTRPDISYAVQQICLHTHDPREPHLAALKRVLCYIRDNLLSWSAKRHVTLSRSSAEAEYRGVANVVAETAWIRNLLRELHNLLFTATIVYCDNVSAVYMSTNPVQHQRTKHIEFDIHFVRDIVARGQFLFSLLFVSSSSRSPSSGISFKVKPIMPGRGRPRNTRQGGDPAEPVANRDPRDIEEIERLQQHIRELELQQDERNEETESNSVIWDDGFDGE
uniref:DUF4283 domain-containing protein n=1 Tax=Tanacetum cinerariifolium TaxID=118510 RepID=A0A699H1X2_TANCI|nr:hypothetical protein [Tanacetum cinerariifolium]